MHSRTAALAATMFVALMTCPVAVSAQATPDTTQLPAPMRAVRAQFNAAMTARNANDASHLFADSAVAEFQGQTFSGRAAILGWLTEALPGLSSLRFQNPKFTISPNEIIETADYVVGTPEGEQTGISESTWRMVNGAWKVIRLRVS